VTFIKKFASKLGVLDYKGTWNAATNTPDLTTNIPKKGYYYVVSTPGATNLSGISEWEAGDWVIYNGVDWQKMDAADKAKTNQLESSINSLSLTVNQLTVNAAVLPTISSSVSALQAVNSSLSNSVNNLTISIQNAKLSEVFYVAKNGNDTSATGSAASPFLTISAALSHIETNILNSQSNVIIVVGPGEYVENVTLTRPKTHLVGLVESRSNSKIISGSLTINPASTVDGVNNSIFAVEGFLISPGTGDAITITGPKECSTLITNCYIYADGPGTQRGLVSNQTSSTKTRIQIRNLLINNVVANSLALDLSNSYTTAEFLTCYAGSAGAVSLLNTTLTTSNSWFENNASSHIVTVSNGSVFSIGNSYLYNKYINGSGLLIHPGGQTVCVNNVFQVTGTGGFAVSGSLGSVFMHAGNCFIYGTSNKISAAIGAGTIPMVTSFTAM